MLGNQIVRAVAEPLGGGPDKRAPRLVLLAILPPAATRRPICGSSYSDRCVFCSPEKAERFLVAGDRR